MVRRIYPLPDHPLLDDDSADGEELIRTTGSGDESKQANLATTRTTTPVRIRRIQDDKHSPPDMYRVGEEDSQSDDEFPSIPTAENLPFPEEDDDDDDMQQSPTGVRDFYPFYDDYGRIQLAPKSYVMRLHQYQSGGLYPESPDISLVDLISEISEEEAAELNAQDKTNDAVIVVRQPPPFQPTLAEAGVSSLQDVYTYPNRNNNKSSTKGSGDDNGVEECKEDSDDDDNHQDNHDDRGKRELFRDPADRTTSFVSENSFIDGNPRETAPVSSRNQLLESPFEWFMDCINCANYCR